MTEIVKENAQQFKVKAKELNYGRMTKVLTAFVVGGKQSKGKEEEVSAKVVEIVNENLPENEYCSRILNLVGVE